MLVFLTVSSSRNWTCWKIESCRNTSLPLNEQQDYLTRLLLKSLQERQKLRSCKLFIRSMPRTHQKGFNGPSPKPLTIYSCGAVWCNPHRNFHCILRALTTLSLRSPALASKPSTDSSQIGCRLPWLRRFPSAIVSPLSPHHAVNTRITVVREAHLPHGEDLAATLGRPAIAHKSAPSAVFLHFFFTPLQPTIPLDRPGAEPVPSSCARLFFFLVHPIPEHSCLFHLPSHRPSRCGLPSPLPLQALARRLRPSFLLRFSPAAGLTRHTLSPSKRTAKRAAPSDNSSTARTGSAESFPLGITPSSMARRVASSSIRTGVGAFSRRRPRNSSVTRVLEVSVVPFANTLFLCANMTLHRHARL